MIPTFKCRPGATTAELGGDLRVLSPSDKQDGWIANRDYQYLRPIPWEDVRAIWRAEADELARVASQAVDVDAFEELADDALDLTVSTPSDELLLDGLELGVIASCSALNAAGFTTGHSCRGHPEPYHGGRERYPLVAFAADRMRLQALRPLAYRAGCHLNLADGIVIMCAPSAKELLDLAELLINEQERFAE